MKLTEFLNTTQPPTSMRLSDYLANQEDFKSDVQVVTGDPEPENAFLRMQAKTLTEFQSANPDTFKSLYGDKTPDIIAKEQSAPPPALESFLSGASNQATFNVYEDKNLQEQNPAAYGVGQVVGGIGSLVATGGTLKALGLAYQSARAGQAALAISKFGPRFVPRAIMTGATFGTHTGINEAVKQIKDGDLNLSQMSMRVAKDTLFGAGLGVAGGVVSRTTSSVIAGGLGYASSKVEGNDEPTNVINGVMWAGAEFIGSHGRDAVLRKEALNNIKDSLSKYAMKKGVADNAQADILAEQFIQKEAAKVGGIDKIIESKDSSISFLEQLNKNIVTKTNNLKVEVKPVDSITFQDTIKQSTEMAKNPPSSGTPKSEIVEPRANMKGISPTEVVNEPSSPLYYKTAKEYVASQEKGIEYHGTSIDNAENILKDGKLKVGAGQKGVSTTQDYNEALDYAGGNPEGVIAVRVRDSAEMVGKPGKDFLTGTGSFSPDDLTVVGRAKTKSQLTAEWEAAQKARASSAEQQQVAQPGTESPTKGTTSQGLSASAEGNRAVSDRQASQESNTPTQGISSEVSSQTSGSLESGRGAEAGLGEQPSSKTKTEMSSQENVPSDENLAQDYDPVQKIIQALKEAKPVRSKQETLYSKERGKRMAAAMSRRSGGEGGFYKELGALKGELPKAEFEAIRDKLTQGDIDALFNMVTDNNKLSFWETVTARTALGKLFGEFGGRVPTKGELVLLNKVFGNELVETLISKMSFWDKLKEGTGQVLNIPRSIMSSFDLSAPLRQGVFLIGRKEFAPAFKEMFTFFGSEKNFKVLQDQIAGRANFELMKESGLALTNMDVMLEAREEAFMSNLAENIPVVGGGIRASGRAYVGFLNKLRADVFDSLVKDAERLGLDPKENRDLAKQIASFVNTATGRGDLGALSNSAVALNNVFFSPRLIASRLALLNPWTYINPGVSNFVRWEAIKSLLAFTSVVATVLGLSGLSGLEVGTDPRSSDFAKIKIHRTRIDIMGGFQQYLRMVGQLFSGKYVSSTTGRVVTLGKGYRALTRKEIIQRQFESKLSPVASFISAILQQQTWDGKKVSVPQEVVDRMTPMVLNDLMTVIKDDPSLIPLEALGLFGVGIQTYDKK